MPPPAATTTPSSSFSGRSGEPRARRRHGGGCGGLRVAGWVGGGIAAAFFASLERCSCVQVRTHDDDLDGGEQKDAVAPLMRDVDDSGGGGAARRRARGKEKSRRGAGFACYVDFNGCD